MPPATFSVRFLVELQPDSVSNSSITCDHVRALEGKGFSFLVPFKPCGLNSFQPIPGRPRRDWLAAEGWHLRGEYHGFSLDDMVTALREVFGDRKIWRVSIRQYEEKEGPFHAQVQGIAVTADVSSIPALHAVAPDYVQKFLANVSCKLFLKDER